MKKTLKPIVRPEIKTRSSRVVNKKKLYRVAKPVPVGVPTPTVYTVPYVKYEYVPVVEEEECPTCCCGGENGISKIVNHTEVNWVNGTGKGRKIMKTINNRDPNDSSEEKEDGPKNWGEVVARFNALNGEKGALTAKGILGGHSSAKKNLEMISKMKYEGAASSYESESSEMYSDEVNDYDGLLKPDMIDSVKHWNMKKKIEGHVYGEDQDINNFAM